MTGAILAARMNRVPVIVDGYVATAAAAVLVRPRPERARSLPVRPRLGRARPPPGAGADGQDPLLDLGMRLGEGTGAALAAGIVKAAARAPRRHGDFAEAGVSTKQEQSRAIEPAPSSQLLASGSRAAVLALDRRQRFHDPRLREGGDRLGALAELRFQLEGAVVHAHQRLHDRQAEAGALFGALDGDRALAEGREHDRDFLRRNARAVVADREELAAAGGPADLDRDLAAGRRELDRVGEEVERDLADGALVRPQPRQVALVSAR